MIIFTGIINTYLISFLEMPVLTGGLILGLVILVYLFIVWRGYRIPKEILIAVFYTVGVLLVPFSLTQKPESLLLPGIQHMILAFMNLLLISYFEREEDQWRGQSNLISTFKLNIGGWLVILFLIQLFIGVYLTIADPQHFEYFAVLISMGCILWAIYIFRKYLFKEDLYGVLADAVFLLPGIIFLLR